MELSAPHPLDLFATGALTPLIRAPLIAPWHSDVKMRHVTVLVGTSAPLLIACDRTMVGDHDNDLLAFVSARAAVPARRVAGVGQLIAFPAARAAVAVAVEVRACGCRKHGAG